MVNKDKVMKSDALIRAFAEEFTISNLGHDPKTTSLDSLYEPGSEAVLDGEMRGWTAVAKKIVKTLEKEKTPLTLKEAERIWNRDNKKLLKEYKKA